LTIPKEALARIGTWYQDARVFVRECLGASPDEWQLEALEAISVGKKDCLALVACKGPGKSTCLAWICLWWMQTRFNAQIIVTSVTRPNLRDGLWKEIGIWYEKSPILKAQFTYSSEKLFNTASPNTWFASARGWSQGADSAEQADTLAGFHAEKAMYLGDEFGSCSLGLMAAAEAVRANANPDVPHYPHEGAEARIVVAGNPTDPTGPLGKISGELRGKPWYVINITSDPDNPKRTPRVPVEWARQQIAMHGRDNPYILVNIFGEFPPSGFSQLFPINLVQNAMARNLTPDLFKHSQKRLAVDVALQGDDETAMMCRQGLAMWLDLSDVLKNASIPDIVARISHRCSRFMPDMVFVDNTGGYGSGVVQGCREASMNVIGVQFAGKADSDKYLNKRAEMYWRMREWLENGGMLPKNDQLLRELVAMKYGTTKNGKFYIEAKDDLKKRLGHSCDLADAAAMTFHLHEQPGMGGENPLFGGAYEAPQARSYNPYAKSRRMDDQYNPFSRERND
jgi:phage terminase large subunit